MRILARHGNPFLRRQGKYWAQLECGHSVLCDRTVTPLLTRRIACPWCTPERRRVEWRGILAVAAAVVAGWVLGVMSF